MIRTDPSPLSLAVHLPGIQVQHCEGSRLWATRGYAVLYSRNNGRDWTSIGQIPTAGHKRLLARFDVSRRLWRLGINRLYVLPDETVLVFADRQLYRLATRETGPQHVHSLRRGRSPLPYGAAILPDGSFVYGEYWSNKEREPVHLYVSHDSGLSWEELHRFPAGTIRHIHAVQWDPFSERIWIATGDQDKECLLLKSDSEIETFEVVGGGTQDWRAVSLLFDDDFIYWGSDRTFDRRWRNRPPADNHLFRLRRSGDVVERLQVVGPPVYFGTNHRSWQLFSTAVEGTWNEWGRDVYVWGSSDGQSWGVILRMAKDRLPHFFGYGLLVPATGTGDYLWLSGQSLRGTSAASYGFKLRK